MTLIQYKKKIKKEAPRKMWTGDGQMQIDEVKWTKDGRRLRDQQDKLATKHAERPHYVMLEEFC